MLRTERLRRQDGFIREILWVALAIAIVAFVLLDAMALFTTHQSVGDNAATAARDARTEYAQTLSLPAAKIAAQQYLAKSGTELVAFSTERSPEGALVFKVKAKAEADTYVFKYLGMIPGLKKWVERTTHPVATGTRE